MMTKIRLGKGDAALVFRKDGIAEAFFPRPHPKTLEEAQNVILAHSLFWAYNNDEMMKAIVDAIRAEPSRMN